MNIRIVPIDQIKAAAYNPRFDLLPGDTKYESFGEASRSLGTSSLSVGIEGIRSWSTSLAKLNCKCL
ncbi:hypothetical protein PAECIP111890_01718 [Paenibacillus sp. JJ-223]|nr:hypothetical protein PAECIP111890_01718 [Paenibacillus sp. JJ-223]